MSDELEKFIEGRKNIIEDAFKEIIKKYLKEKLTILIRDEIEDDNEQKIVVSISLDGELLDYDTFFIK